MKSLFKSVLLAGLIQLGLIFPLSAAEQDFGCTGNTVCQLADPWVPRIAT